MKVYETKGNQYNEHNSGGLKTGRPTVSPKKDTKDDVSSPGTKYVYLSMIQKMEQKGKGTRERVCVYQSLQETIKGL